MPPTAEPQHTRNAYQLWQKAVSSEDPNGQSGMPTPMRWGALTDAQKAPFVKLAIEDERREKDEKKLLDASMVLARLSKGTWNIERDTFGLKLCTSEGKLDDNQREYKFPSVLRVANALPSMQGPQRQEGDGSSKRKQREWDEEEDSKQKLRRLEESVADENLSSDEAPLTRTKKASKPHSQSEAGVGKKGGLSVMRDAQKKEGDKAVGTKDTHPTTTQSRTQLDTSTDPKLYSSSSTTSTGKHPEHIPLYSSRSSPPRSSPQPQPQRTRLSLPHVKDSRQFLTPQSNAYFTGVNASASSQGFDHTDHGTSYPTSHRGSAQPTVTRDDMNGNREWEFSRGGGYATTQRLYADRPTVTGYTTGHAPPPYPAARGRAEDILSHFQKINNRLEQNYRRQRQLEDEYEDDGKEYAHKERKEDTNGKEREKEEMDDDTSHSWLAYAQDFSN